MSPGAADTVCPLPYVTYVGSAAELFHINHVATAAWELIMPVTWTVVLEVMALVGGAGLCAPCVYQV